MNLRPYPRRAPLVTRVAWVAREAISAFVFGVTALQLVVLLCKAYYRWYLFWQ